MDTSQNQQNSNIPVVDYTPAELKKGNKGNWRIEFYVLNPVTKKMKRYQRRVKPISNLRLRERFGKRMAAEVNKKLEKGWNPLTEMEASKGFAILEDVFDSYINNLKKQYSDKSIRFDTLRSYTSYITNLREWIKSKHGNEVYCLNFDKRIVSGFLDHIYFERNNSPRTYNNYLAFLNILSRYLIQRDYIKANPAEKFEKKRNQEKKRKPIPVEVRKDIISYLEKYNKGMMVVVQLMYYEFIRRTEISKLKVSDINLKDGFILLRSTVSKNRRQQYIVILKPFLPIISKHIKGANPTDFVFSQNNLMPGSEKIEPKRISDEWKKLREILDLDERYQMYSLKDTGIENMLKAGIPSIKVRDHARHSELSTTEKYTQRNNAVDINDDLGDFEF